MSSLHSEARAISYFGLSSTDLPGDVAISWTLSIIDWQVQIPNNLFYNNVVCTCKAVEWRSVYFLWEASRGVAESKDLDSKGPELKLSFAKHASLGKALSVHLLLLLISMTDDMN